MHRPDVLHNTNDVHSASQPMPWWAKTVNCEGSQPQIICSNDSIPQKIQQWKHAVCLLRSPSKSLHLSSCSSHQFGGMTVKGLAVFRQESQCCEPHLPFRRAVQQKRHELLDVAAKKLQPVGPPTLLNPKESSSSKHHQISTYGLRQNCQSHVF